MIFLNLMLLGGLLAAAAPIIVHILHQRRLQQIDWGAMRFLREMMTRRRRRVRIEQWLLLLLRIAALLMLALALMRPQWTAEHNVVAEDHQRRGAVAAVLLLDDSASSGVMSGDDSRWEALRQLAHTYLDGLAPGDEVSVIRRSQLGTTLPPPLYDLQAARSLIDAIEPTIISADHNALLSAGLDQLARHLNPHREVVLFSDGSERGWRQDDRAAWAQLQRRVRHLEQESAPAVQLMLMQPAFAESNDVAITGLHMERNILPVGSTATVRIDIAHHGQRDPGSVRLRLRHMQDDHDELLHEEDLVLQRGQRREVSAPLQFADPGAHAVVAELVGVRDDFPVSDRRALIIETFEQLPVLVVEGRSGPGLQGSGAFVALALDPDPEEVHQIPRAFAVTRVHVDALIDQPLDRYRCVVLCDVGMLDPDAVSALERAVRNGVGLLMGLSADDDVEYINRFMARDGHGIVPLPLRGPADAANGSISAAIALPQHPALSSLRQAGDNALQGAAVRRWMRVDSDASHEVSIPLRLTNGEAALVMRRRGLGHTALLTTGMDLRGSRLPLVEGWAPLLRDVVAELASPIRPPRNLVPGQRLTVTNTDSGVQVLAPDGSVLPLHSGAWEGRTVRQTDPLLHPGIYRMQVPGAEMPANYALAAESGSFDISIVSEAARQRQLAGLDVMHLPDEASVAALSGMQRSGGGEWWPWLIAACLLLLMAESTWAARSSRVARQGGGQ